MLLRLEDMSSGPERQIVFFLCPPPARGRPQHRRVWADSGISYPPIPKGAVFLEFPEDMETT
jgi:hypothetical protein